MKPLLDKFNGSINKQRNAISTDYTNLDYADIADEIFIVK